MSVRALLTRGNLWNQLTAQEREALEAVKDIAPDVVLATPEVDLVGQLYDKFWIEPLQLHRGDKVRGQGRTIPRRL